MEHWLATTGALITAITVIYASARQALKRAVGAFHNMLAVWRLPECVESLTKAVGTLTTELAHLRGEPPEVPDKPTHRRGSSG
jgi:hypothetical protein